MASQANSHNTDQVTVPATAGGILILPHNGGRVQGTITNPSSSVIVYIGGVNVTVSNGQALLPGNSYTTYSGGAWYGIVTSSTQVVSYADETE